MARKRPELYPMLRSQSKSQELLFAGRVGMSPRCLQRLFRHQALPPPPAPQMGLWLFHLFPHPLPLLPRLLL